MINYRKILIQHYPDKKWTASDTSTYEQIDWVDQDTKPSKATLDAMNESAALALLKSQVTSEVKIQAYNRIVAVYPEWKQRNLAGAVTEIQNKEIIALKSGGANYTPTSEEMQILIAAKACKDFIDAIRAKSNELETSSDSMTEEQLNAFDPSEDSNWE